MQVQTPLFKGIDQSELSSLLMALRARVVSVPKNHMIYQEGQFVHELGILIKGSIVTTRTDYSGHKNILGNLCQGQIFAATYALLHAHVMVNLIANEDCEIVFLNLNMLSDIENQSASWYPKLITNLMRILGQENLELSKQGYHTISKHIRGRVWSYLTTEAREHASNEFDIPFNRQQMADYLNLDRSALSNELGKMRDEHLIEFRKNHFKILDGPITPD